MSAGPTASCWCEPEKPGKCWQRSEKTEAVQNILKGGEDSIGLLEAIQRVYFNIGSCAEQCWLNHVPDLRSLDPKQRNYGQTPLNIGQCRRDCASFRAVEDRLQNLADFLLTGRPADLHVARGVSREELRAQLDREFGEGSVAPRAADLRAHMRRLSLESGRAPRRCRLPRRRSERPDAAARFPQPRAPRTCEPRRHVGGTCAAFEPYVEPRMGRVCRPRPARAAGRSRLEGSDEGRRPRILSPAFAVEPVGLRAVHAQQSDRAGSVRQAIQHGRRFYSSPYVDGEGKPLANAPAC